MAQDPYRYFRIEARELVADLAKGVLELERVADPPTVAKLLRAAHTLKGAARIVKHRELAQLAHAMEDALAPLREAPVPQRLDAAFVLIDRMTAQLETLGSEPVAPATAPMAAPPAEAPIRRLDTDALDEALGGLATVHALVGQLRAGTGSSAQILDAIDRGLREVRRDVEQVRMPAIGSLFVGLERTARDTALAAGRQVAFAGTGGAVRLDSQVLLALSGALIQLVRNAVVHGIEPPARRRAAGKPERGRIAIDVRSLGRRIAVSCEDDGGGLDVEAIRRIAIARGVATDRASEPGELFQLLLRGGISTTRQVTELSGRGVGLDLVREAVHGLGGEITVTSTAHGTCITLIVPMSIAAVPIIELEIGDRIVGIPQAAVRRIARLRTGDLVHTPSGDSICIDDITVPCASLSALVCGTGAHGTTVVFIDGGHGLAAVTVERVLGIDEAVVRAVPSAPIDPIVWGLVLDSKGLPYPVLEPRALVEAARVASPPVVAAAPPRTRVLIVDDSLTTRMLEQSILQSAGFDVSVADSAEQGLARLAAEPFALVLVDVEMPGMDGFAMITEMRSRPALAATPAIMVTSRDAAADRRRGELVGAQGYVIKSEFDQVVLLDLIRRLVPS